MTEQAELAIEWEPSGRQGDAMVKVLFPDETTHTHKLNITKESARVKLADRICEKGEGVSREDLLARLEEIASQVMDCSTSGSDGDGETGVDELIAIGTGEHVELFHTPGEYESGGYASIQVDGHRETWPIESKGFQRWLGHLYFKTHGKATRSQAVTDAVATISSMAIYDGEERQVFLRVAGPLGDVFIDLCDENWSAVRVHKDGWEVMESQDVPVRFVRRSGMLPLPVPEKGGSVDDLRSLVNMPTNDLWVLYVGVLVSYLLPSGPYPILVLCGEQGSAKSTAARFTKRLIDPNKAPLRRPPRSDRDLMIAAGNSWLVSFDNLSEIRPGLSDSLCVLATGGGFATRELYSDDSEKIFEAQRPVMVNGIEDMATRSDLLDRAVVLYLPSIPEEERREEADILVEFEGVLPRVLGALMDAVSSVLRNRGKVELTTKPRMADFAIAVTAAEEALGWESGTFMKAYTGNRDDAQYQAIDASPVGPAILGLMHSEKRWSGTPRELLTKLEDYHSDKKTRDRRDWPKNPRGMTAALLHITPNLRATGIALNRELEAGGARRRLIYLERQSESPSPPDDSWTVAGRSKSNENVYRPEGTGDSSPSEWFWDGRDGRDGRDPSLEHGQTPSAKKVCVDPGPKAGSRPSRPSRPSQDRPDGAEKADGAGRCQDGSGPGGTVDRPGDGRDCAIGGKAPGGKQRPCYLCHKDRFWRLRVGGQWTCGGCHPPSMDEALIEWRENSGGRHG